MSRVAVVHGADPDYYTQSRDITDIEVVDVDDEGRTGDVDAFFGTVRVTNQVVSYVMKLVSTNEVIDEIPLPLPPQHLETKAVWWTIPQVVVDRAAVSARELPGAVHAAEHAAIGLLPLVATCDRWDVGGVSTPLHPDTGLCTIFIYDGYPGGAGITERGFRTAERWLAATLEAITQCPCTRGCPSCVQSPKCGNGNEPLDKQGAARCWPRSSGDDGDELGVAQRLERAARLRQMEPVVAGDHPERQVVALRAALGVDPQPLALIGRRPPPQRDVGQPQRLEQVDQPVGVRLVGVQAVDPQVLVVADQRRLVLRQHPPVPGDITISASAMWAMHSSADHSAGSGRSGRYGPASAANCRSVGGVPAWTAAGSSSPSSPSRCV